MSRWLFPITFLLLISSAAAVVRQYFPDHAFTQRDDLSTFKVSWYQKDLDALREPSLWELSKQSSTNHVYRFLWLRSFHHPIAVRLNINPDGTGTLTTKVCSGAGGYDPGKLIVNRNERVAADRVKWFLDQVDEQHYWSLTTEEEDPNTVGVDGAQWVLEAVKNGNYKVVDRWSPENGPIKSLGLTFLIDFAKLKLLYQEVY